MNKHSKTKRSARAPMDRLSYEILHDIISPINGLLLYMEVNKARADMRRLMAPISSAHEKIRSFIHNITCATQNQKKDDIVNLESVILEVMDIMRPKALRNDVSMNFIRKHNANLIIASSIKIYQIFINIISNSIEALEQLSDSRVKIINVTIDRDGSGMMKIVVSDNGIGFDGHAGQVFNSGYTTKPNGVGVGLCTVKEIVENSLDGQIEIKSEKDNYSEIIIKIPRKRIVGSET